MQLVKEVTLLREAKRKFEDDITKIKNSHNTDILQVIYFDRLFFSIYFFYVFILLLSKIF